MYRYTEGLLVDEGQDLSFMQPEGSTYIPVLILYALQRNIAPDEKYFCVDFRKVLKLGKEKRKITSVFDLFGGSLNILFFCTTKVLEADKVTES